MINLEDIDIFTVLQLTHFSDEQKLEYTNKLLEIAILDIASQDLPNHMTEEEINTFSTQYEEEATRQQAMDFLKQKFPDFDGFVKAKVLALKKDLMQANIEERIDINKQEYDSLIKESQDSEEIKDKIEKNQSQDSHLKELLTAIESDDWKRVYDLTTKN